MTDQEIIERDYTKNHQNREYDDTIMQAAFNQYARSGGLYYRDKLVLVVYRPVTDQLLEFHCVNGGYAGDLVDAVNNFFRMVQDNYEFAVTYYDNPRVKELCQQIHARHATEKIDRGLDATYETIFDLRSL